MKQGHRKSEKTIITVYHTVTEEHLGELVEAEEPVKTKRPSEGAGFQPPTRNDN